MLTEVYRERSSIAATLLSVLLFCMVLGIGTTPMTTTGPMSSVEMSLASGTGFQSLLGTAAIVAGVVAVGLAVTCVAAPFAAPLIISSVFGAAGTWMAGSGTLAVGVGILGASGAAGIVGGAAAIASDN